MDNNITALSGLAAAIAGGFVGKKLAGRPWWLRWTAILLAAGAAGGALGFTEKYAGSYSQRHDPAAAAGIEKEMMSLAPMLLPIVKEDNPQAWQAFINKAGDKVAASGGDPSPEDMKQIGSEFRAMVKNVWFAVAMSDDATIQALARQEIVMDETLQRESVQMCATRGDPLWNLNDLPPESLKAVQSYMMLVALAYRQGRGRQLDVVTDDQANRFLQEAALWSGSPLSDEDAAYLSAGDKSDPPRTCRVRMQFEKNMLLIPDSTALLRWMNAHSIQ